MLTAAAPTTRQRYGGNLIIFTEVEKNAGGTAFQPLASGTDCFGDPFTTAHILGSQEQTDFARSASGQHTADVTIVEMDVDHKNLLINAAPFSSTSSDTAPELKLEDGTVLQASDTSSGDDTMPYFQFEVFGTPVNGDEQVFSFVGQFAKETSFSQKANEWSKPKIKIVSIDALGFTPTFGAHARLTGLTEVALSGSKAHGIWISG
jgi:hypothetical protein